MWCNCSSQFLGHSPGCSLLKIIIKYVTLNRRLLSCCRHSHTGVVNFGQCSSGCHLSRQHRQSFGSQRLQMRSGRTTSLSQSLLSSAVLPPLSALAMREAGRWNTWLKPLHTCFQNANQMASQSASRQYMLTCNETEVTYFPIDLNGNSTLTLCPFIQSCGLSTKETCKNRSNY